LDAHVQNEDLITLTSDIVAAHASNNRLSIEELARLVGVVHQALGSLGQEVEPAPVQKTPVVSARASVKDEYLVCMECGARQKTLKRHLMTAHQMTPQTYRADFALPDTYPMTAPAYSRTRAQMAKSFGLGRKAGQKRGGKPKLGLKFEGPADKP
jgi:predicted transcriptional regulator